jgi:hypothetical protein
VGGHFLIMDGRDSRRNVVLLVKVNGRGHCRGERERVCLCVQ